MGDFQGEYIQQFLCNINLRKRLKNYLKRKQKYSKNQSNQKKKEKISHLKKGKRLRSLASQIERNFQCPLSKCGKKYGSEGSLNQHIKLKHPELVNKA